jgi:PKD repeat protein
MKSFYNKLIFSFGLVLLFAGTSFAQIIKTESFDATTYPPTGWTINFPAPGGTTLWTRPTVYTSPTCTPHSGVGTTRYSTRTTVGATQTLITPVFDLSAIGTDTATVSIWVFRTDTATTTYDTLNVMVNTAADTNGAVILGTIARSITLPYPDTQATRGWYQYTFNIPASFNGTTNYLLFRGVTRSGGTTAYRIYVDDISYKTFPAACSGMPTAGTISSVDTLFCGSGVARLLLSGASAGQPGLSYQWQYATTSGGPYTDFGSGQTSVTDTITATTYFRCGVICNTTNDTAYTSEFISRIDTNPAPNVVVTASSTTYCSNSGSAPTIIVTGANTYTWSSTFGLTLNTTRDTVVAAPFTSTTYIITGRNAAGCSDTASVRITVSQNPNVSATPATVTACSGDSITLTATATGTGGGGGGGAIPSTFVWNPGGFTGSTVTLPVDSAMTYYVIGTSTAGCSGANSVDSVVVAISNPVASAITAVDTMICGGSGTTQLSINASSAFNNQWYSSSTSTGPWTPTTNQGNTITTDTLTTPTYFINVASCPSGFSDTSVAVFINVSSGPLPVVSLNTVQAYYCQAGNPVLLIASGASSYSWAPGTGLNSTSTDSVYCVLPGNSTVYTVTGYDSFGCSDTAIVRVNRATNPVVTVNPLTSTVCSGSELTLRATATNLFGAGITYTWEPGSITADSIVINPTSNVQYIVTGVSSYGCSNAGSVDTSNITVNPLAVANFSFVASGDTVAFLNFSTDATAYSWDFGDSTTSSSQTPFHVYPVDGTYNITLIASNNCNSDTFTTAVSINVLGISQPSSSAASIMPNPAGNFLNVKFAGATDRVEVLDLMGHLMLSRSVDTTTDRNIQFDLSSLSSGVYFVRVTNQGSSSLLRFVKQ